MIKILQSNVLINVLIFQSRVKACKWSISVKHTKINFVCRKDMLYEKLHATKPLRLRMEECHHICQKQQGKELWIYRNVKGESCTRNSIKKQRRTYMILILTVINHLNLLTSKLLVHFKITVPHNIHNKVTYYNINLEYPFERIDLCISKLQNTRFNNARCNTRYIWPRIKVWILYFMPELR